MNNKEERKPMNYEETLLNIMGRLSNDGKQTLCDIAEGMTYVDRFQSFEEGKRQIPKILEELEILNQRN
jgi:hypothetical protein